MARRTQRITTARKPGIMSRLRARTRPTTTVTTTTTTTRRGKRANRAPMTASHHHHHAGTTVPAHHQRRHATMGDKVSGALMKLRGSLTRRPGLKAAGTRRMHGTDGRGAHRVY